MSDIAELFDPTYSLNTHGSGCFSMIYHSFLDDSKDRGAKRLMVSAGFYATKEVWQDFKVAWKRVLDSHGLAYYKSSECFSVDGEFRKFRKGQYATPEDKAHVQSIRAELQSVVISYPSIRGVGIAVQLEHYRRLAQLPEAFEILPQNPYKAALSSVMFETVKAIRKHAVHPMVAFVHDDSDEFDDLRKCYQEFRRINPITAKAIGGFEPMDDKTTYALQAADLVASHTTFLASRVLDMREAEVEMRQNIARLGIWDETYVTKVLKHGLLKRNKPIPLDIG